MRFSRAVFLMTLVCVIGVGLAGPAAAAKDGAIVVSGDAVIRVAPDQVVLTVGVSTRDSVITTSKKMNDEKCARLLAALDDLGIGKKDIQSDHLRIEPKHDIHDRFLGYDVNRVYVITIHEVARFEEILTAVLDAGIEHVLGISFQTTELQAHRDGAREAALLDARRKAGKMSAALGRDVGRAVSINEQWSRWSSSYGEWWGSGRNPQTSQVMIDAGADGEMGGAFEPGKISVRSTVSVTFELK